MELNEIMRVSKKREQAVEADIYGLRMEIEMKAAVTEEQALTIKAMDKEISRLADKERLTARNFEAKSKEVLQLKHEKRELKTEIKKYRTNLAVMDEQQKAIRRRM